MTLDSDNLLQLAYVTRKRALEAARTAGELRQLTCRTMEIIRISRNLIYSSDSAIGRFRTLTSDTPWRVSDKR